ncbi:MAG: dihydrofolate reductase [Deltaproteobacteria bacterium]|nr:dihydrofolate reductase [Deltaproteobacteria bacterium]
MKYFKAIAAMAENRVIGRGHEIPWHLPEDFRWFRQVTTGQVIVLGRKTFEAMGRVLPGRTTVVVSRSGVRVPGVRTVSDLCEIDPAREQRDVFICGGAQLYETALPFCSDLYLTLVKRRVEGDVLFPAFEDAFDEVAVLRETPTLRIVHYRNRSPVPLQCRVAA